MENNIYYSQKQWISGKHHKYTQSQDKTDNQETKTPTIPHENST